MNLLNEKQYATPDNFNARIYLTAMYKTNPETWNHWLYKHLPTAENLKILELGCETGLFWRMNHQKIPRSWQITLTDYSRGMLENTQKNLNGINFPFHNQVVNAEDLQYEIESFDIIIANLMLYHLPDRHKALTGISRILKTGGCFIASTFGRRNMFELNALLYNYFKDFGKGRPVRDNAFLIENGS